MTRWFLFSMKRFLSLSTANKRNFVFFYLLFHLRYMAPLINSFVDVVVVAVASFSVVFFISSDVITASGGIDCQHLWNLGRSGISDTSETGRPSSAYRFQVRKRSRLPLHRVLPALLSFHTPVAFDCDMALSSTWFYLDLPGFTGFYWGLLGFTGLYWVLLGFTGLYWVLLGDTGFLVGPTPEGFRR